MNAAPVVFSATGTIQTYFVPAAGTYAIEAAGGQGGAGASPGSKGSRVSGMFFLKRGDLLKIVVGSQGTPAALPHDPSGGGGGSSMVWTGPADLPAPIKLMLSARGGSGGGAVTNPNAGGVPASGGGDHVPAADSKEPISTGAGLDHATFEALITQWSRATEAAPSITGNDWVQVDRGGYNAGAFRTSTPEVQLGDGYVSIKPVSVSTASGSTDQRPPGATAPAADDARASAPASDPAGASGTVSGAPSRTKLPRVTPRLESWKNLLRRRRRP